MDAIINLQPKETSNYLNRAFVRYNNDDYFGAMSDYNYILELEPDNLPARYNRALLLYEVRDLQKSVRDFTEVLRQRPDNFHAIYAFVTFDSGGWHEDSYRPLQIVQKYPRFHQGYYSLASFTAESGNAARDRRGSTAVPRVSMPVSPNPHPQSP